MSAATPSAPPIPAATEHPHHWRLEEANGPESVAVCKICGARKSFRNWLPETDYISGEGRRTAA